MGTHPIYDNYKPTDYQFWITHHPTNHTVYEWIDSLRHEYAFYEYLTIKHTSDFVVYDFWLSIKPEPITLDDYISSEVAALMARAESLEMKIKTAHSYKRAPSSEEIKSLRGLIDFLRNKLESNIEITGPIICLVHAFAAHIDPRYNLDERKRFFDWDYKKSYVNLVATYNDTYKGCKIINDKIKSADPKNTKKKRPSPQSINPLIKNIETAIRLLKTRCPACCPAATDFAEKKLESLREAYAEN